MMRIHHSEEKIELYCKRAEMQRIHSTYFILHMCSATLRLVTKAKNNETLISHTQAHGMLLWISAGKGNTVVVIRHVTATEGG